eukprot:Blabericola_migrator_1__5724@NODE_2900_length_2224_cov_309_404265_g1821_i0_p1_GENE_NODE_2900_length_2224_cov_309_404265_g1821_i0NODE_2900_length_2224_cov_309_404265_g1821_i0_p1_ORF_typecomplete_len422_score58_25Acyl_transf_3/PF01757_22/3e15_NODE_2900_length_2224_cov_309_404265_g1821_i06761941
MAKRNLSIEGLKWILSFMVVQVHNFAASDQIAWVKGVWGVVNCFFVISAFLAYKSLTSSWKRLQKVVEPEVVDLAQKPIHKNTRLQSTLTLATLHYVDYLIKRVVPYFWIAAFTLLAFWHWSDGAVDSRLVTRLFHPNYNLITGLWWTHLRHPNLNARRYPGNPVFWYLSSISLFTVLVPIMFHILRLYLKSSQGGNLWIKRAFYIPLPAALCIADYFIMRISAFPDAMSKPEDYTASLNFQVCPLAYIGKYFTAVIACALWHDVFTVSKLQRFMRWVPLTDIIIAVQIMIYYLVETHVFEETQWTVLYISLYLIGNCCLVFVLMNEIGHPFILGRLLKSRFLHKTGGGLSFMIYILHFPLVLVLKVQRRGGEGQILLAMLTWLLSQLATHAHAQVMSRYSRLTSRVIDYTVTSLFKIRKV